MVRTRILFYVKWDANDEMHNPPITETFHELLCVLKKITGELLQENKGANSCDFSLGKALLDLIPKVQVTKEKLDKLNFIKIQNFSS